MLLLNGTEYCKQIVEKKIKTNFSALAHNYKQRYP